MNGMSTPLRLTTHAGPIPAPAQRFPITARFTNASPEPVRLLTLFDPLPVFFTASLSPVGGNGVDIAGMGKMDPLEGTLSYAQLSPGAHLDAPLDLASWIRGRVAPGEHQLSLQYHNVYGADCFKGVLDSMPITVQVGQA